MGAAANAATSKESTQLHARLLDEHTEEAFDLLAEMLLRPSLPEDEVDSEREVVLEEIAMYEDEPQDRVHDVLAAAVHGDHPLGRRVLGDAQVIGSIPVAEIMSYHHARYTGPNLVIAAAGHLDHEQIVELAQRLLRPPAGERNGVPARGGISTPRPGSRSRSRRPSSTTSASGARGSRAPMSGASRWGSWMRSSAARPPRGCSARCARSAASRTRSAPTASSTWMAAWSRCTSAPARRTCARPARSSAASSETLRDHGVSAEELERAKEHVKGRLVLGLEATGARMSRLARAILFGVPLLSLDEMLERIEQVSAEDVAELATELYDPERLSTACIGPDEEHFREATGRGQRGADIKPLFASRGGLGRSRVDPGMPCA